MRRICHSPSTTGTKQQITPVNHTIGSSVAVDSTAQVRPLTRDSDGPPATDITASTGRLSGVAGAVSGIAGIAGSRTGTAGMTAVAAGSSAMTANAPANIR